jgi:hypothetical protein
LSLSKYLLNFAIAKAISIKKIMFRILLSFILTVFLFIGILSTANYFFSTDFANKQEIYLQPVKTEIDRLTIKEIDLRTAEENFYFTSKNSVK